MGTGHFNQVKKQSLFGWCFFDFANSIPAVIGGIYFSKWFITDIGAGSVIFNAIFFIASVVILITGKLIGRQIDINGYKYWIKFSALFCFGSICSLFIASQLLTNDVLIPVSFGLFLIFLFCYQIGRVCHNVYLYNIIPESLQSKMSGFGTASNWLGSILSILITIPIIYFFPGRSGREYTFLAAAISYGPLVSLALYGMFQTEEKSNFSRAIKEKAIELNIIIKSIGGLLLIYLLLFDVMATVQRNLPSFLSIVIKMPDNIQNVGFLVILFSAVVGGILASKVVKFENSLLILKWSSALLAISIVMITMNNNIVIWTAFALAGLCYGMLESSMRINFMTFVPTEKAGESFGLFAAVERMSGVVGPIIWAIPFLSLQSENLSFIFAMLLMAALSFTCFITLYFIKMEKINLANY